MCIWQVDRASQFQTLLPGNMDQVFRHRSNQHRLRTQFVMLCFAQDNWDLRTQAAYANGAADKLELSRLSCGNETQVSAR